MRKIIILHIALVIGNFCQAQTWTDVDGGMNCLVIDFIEYNGELYVGGCFTIAGGDPANYVAKWNGSSWTALGTLEGIQFSRVTSFAVYNNELYIGGNFENAEGTFNIARWNGTNWGDVGGGVNSTVNDLAVYNGELYAVGSFSIAGGVPAIAIARWNGVNWSSMGSWFGNNSQYVVCAYNGELYAGGQHQLSKWNGSNWSLVATLRSSSWPNDGNIWELLDVYNGELYAGGGFDSVNGICIHNLAKWNGTNWDSVGATLNGVVNSMTIHNGSLYVGGGFNYSGSTFVSRIAKWDGTNWGPVGLGIYGGINANVAALFSYNNELYAGGFFSAAGSISAMYIARWSPYVGLEEVLNDKDVLISPNPATNQITVHPDFYRDKVESVEVFDVMGKKVNNFSLTPNPSPSGEGSASIDVSSLTPGIYFITLTDENGNKAIRKFVKM